MFQKKIKSVIKKSFFSALIVFALVIAPVVYLIEPANGTMDTKKAAAVNVKQKTPVTRLPIKNILGAPMRLKIPAIKVDSAVELVGVTRDGLLDVPKNFSNAAWYKSGQKPGEKGTAVMVGHYGRKNGKGSVFDNLGKLKKGDKIYTYDKNNVATVFVVREIRKYDPNAKTTDIFRSTDGKAHLNIITCDGKWNSITKSFSKRLVVFADKF